MALVLCLGIAAGCAQQNTIETETASPSGQTPAVVKSKYTLLLYICGSDLETKRAAASKNITELLSAELPEGTNVVLQTGGTRKWRDHGISAAALQRFAVEEGRLLNLDSLPNASMGSEATLTDFLLWGIEEYPAEKYGVILWDHGSGGTPDVCFDENYDMDALSLVELEGALSAARDAAGKELEFIGFDACLMGNYETVLVGSRYARHMIASQELEPVGGWDYAAAVPSILQEDYDAVLKSYAEKCEASGKENYTLAHIDLEKMASVNEAFNEFARQLSADAVNKGLKYIVSSAYRAIAFGANAEKEGYSDIIDLADFADRMGFDRLRQEILSCVTAVNGAEKQNASGISLFYPLHSADRAEAFIREATDTEYKTFLKQNYTGLPTDRKLISFMDTGSDKNGELYIQITEDSEKYVSRVEYKLFRFVTESENVTRVLSCGTDSDVISDGDGGYTSSFGGVWATFQNEFLSCSVVCENENSTLFSTPVLWNGEQGNLRFLYTPAVKSFDVQGFLPLSTAGEASRLQEVQPGDKITLLYDERTYEYTESLHQGKTFIFKGNDDFDVESFPNGYFQLMIMVQDVFGNVYYSDCAVAEWKDEAMRIEVIAYVAPELLS